jgi:hypothetical protein
MRLSYWHYGVIVCSLATATFHILCYPYFGLFDPIVLNGFGSLALLAAYFLPIPFFMKRRRIFYWTIIGYALLTILLWIILGDKTFKFESTAALGYYAKVAEMFLLIFMMYDLPKYLSARAKN